MPLALSQLSAPAFTQGLEAMAAILAKAEAHAAERKIDEAIYLQARLAPDMFPMVRQVQIACDHAKGATARLAGVPVQSFPDEETSFAALRARIARTLDVVRSASAQDIDAGEDRRIELKMPSRVLAFTGRDYLLSFALPNFYFHLATAYDLLRHNGLPIGKTDFIGQARLS